MNLLGKFLSRGQNGKRVGVFFGLATAVFAGSHTAGAATPSSKKSEVKPAEKTVATNAPTAKSAALPYVAALPATLPEAPMVKLSNGAVLITRMDRLAPRVAISLLFKAGAADEETSTSGWRRFLADAMLRGSTDANNKASENREVRRMAENLGGNVGATVGDDQIEFWAIGDSGTQDKLLNLLLQMALHPRLSDADIETARENLLARLGIETGDVPTQAVNALRDQLYRNPEGQAVAYGLPGNGLENSIKSLTPTQLRRLHAAFFRPERLVVASAGDINEAQIKSQLDNIAKGGDVSGDNLPPGLPPHITAPSSERPPLVVKQYPSTAQVPIAWLFAGYTLPAANSEDLPALRVLCAILGEMPRSRLERRLLGVSLVPESSDPMVFQAATQWTPRRWAGEMVVFAQTRSSDIEGVKNSLLDEVSKMYDVPVTQPEIDRAKNFLRGSWATDRENLRDRAFQTALSPALSGADPKFSDIEWTTRLAKVTAEDVRRVAGKYLKNYALTLIMPED